MAGRELPVSDMVLANINPSFYKITVIPGEIEKFVQLPNTDSLNAPLLHYQKGGEKVMEELPSHHQMIIVGKQKAKIVQIAKVFG